MRNQSMLLAATLLATLMATVSASAQTPTQSKQPYFAPKRVLLVPMTKPADKNKTLSPELEEAVAQSLRNLFSAPEYRVVSEKEAVATLIYPQTEITESPTEPSAIEVTEALVRAGKKTNADTVVLAIVREASSRQVTLFLWNVDVKTAKATIEGQNFRRSWSDYPVTTPNKDGGYSTSVKFPPMSTTDQKRLIGRMLMEWSTGIPNLRSERLPSP